MDLTAQLAATARAITPSRHQVEHRYPEHAHDEEDEGYHVELAAHETAFRALESAIEKRECGHEHEKVVDIAFPAHVVEIVGHDNVGNTCRQQRDRQRTQNLQGGRGRLLGCFLDGVHDLFLFMQDLLAWLL